MAGVLALVAAGCGGGDQAGPAVSEENLTGDELIAAAQAECKSISWYASSDGEFVDRISDDFQKEYGIEVDWIEAGSADITSRLITEVRAGSPKADVVTVPIESLAPLADQDMFRPYNSAHIGDVDPKVIESFGDYAQFASPLQMAAFGIVYNTNKVAEADAPKSWKDLLGSHWQGKMAGADPRYGVTYAAVIDFIAEENGWEYWDQIGPNLRLARGGGDTQALLVTGEKDLLAYGGTAPAVKAINEDNAPIAFIAPEEGLQVYTVVSAVTEASDCPNGSKLLIDYMTSRVPQEMVVGYGYYAARADIPSPKGAPDLDEVKWMPTRWQSVADPDSYNEIVNNFEQAIK